VGFCLRRLLSGAQAAGFRLHGFCAVAPSGGLPVPGGFAAPAMLD
jgi:hypothetical protein